MCLCLLRCVWVRCNIFYGYFDKGNNFSIGGMLSIADLNLIIKYYAFRVQQRIEQLEHYSCSALSEPFEDPSQQYQFISVISKYSNYQTVEEREVRLGRRFNERLLQIFQYFRERSNCQNLLAIIQNRIERETNAITSSLPVKLGELFSYVHLITKRGGLVRPPAEKKRVLSKSILKEKTEERQTTYSIFNIQKRVSSGVASNKHLKTSEKLKPEQIISTIWSGLDLDRVHLHRLRQGNQAQITKQMLRRNQKALLALKKEQRRRTRRTVTETSQQNQPAILGEMRLNSLKGGWTSKKRRPILASRKKHNSIKENISIIV